MKKIKWETLAEGETSKKVEKVLRFICKLLYWVIRKYKLDYITMVTLLDSEEPYLGFRAKRGEDTVADSYAFVR